MTSPLHDLHQQAEAEFLSYGSIQTVNTYGSVPAEYACIRKSCGLMDLPFRGMIELTGRDRLLFLNNLLSNQTFDKSTKTPLPAGKVVYAFLLDAKSGRIIADVNVVERGERTLLELDARLVEHVAQALEKYVFTERVTIIPRSTDLHEIALHGPDAHTILDVRLGVGESTEVGVSGSDVIVWRDDPTGSPGLFIVGPKDIVRTIWQDLQSRFGSTEALGKRQLRPIGWAAFNSARIEAGRALFGVDFDDSILPHETGHALNRAVSFTKGCYPGQEIVARMQARQQVARKIVGLKLEDDALPLAGAKVLDDRGNEVGGITSSTISPMLSGTAIALALLKRPQFEIGTFVSVPAEGRLRRAEVVALPFVRIVA